MRGDSHGEVLLRFVHRDADAAFLGDFDGAVVPGVGVADDAHAGIVGQEARELFRGEVGAVGDGDLACVDGAADAYPAAVVDGNPGGAGGRVEQGIEQRPVGDRVGAVGHGLGLAVGGGDGAG